MLPPGLPNVIAHEKSKGLVKSFMMTFLFQLRIAIVYLEEKKQ